MLTHAVARAVSVRRKQCFADIVRRVVGEIVCDDDAGQQWKLADPLSRRGEKCGSAGWIRRDFLESTRRNQHIDGLPLRLRQRVHCHGTSPRIETVGLART